MSGMDVEFFCDKSWCNNLHDRQFYVNGYNFGKYGRLNWQYALEYAIILLVSQQYWPSKSIPSP